MPKYPNNIYAEWQGWPHFLGPKRDRWATYEEARKFAHSQQVKSSKEWRELDRPANMPANPPKMYKDKGWEGWRHFLGKKWASFVEASQYDRESRILSASEWMKHALPANIPRKPNDVNKNEWISWGHFLRESIRLVRPRMVASLCDLKQYLGRVPTLEDALDYFDTTLDELLKRR